MRIIVIEDNELYKNELLQCLEQEESDIEIVGSASNGAEGLALTEKLIRDNLTPDVIFTDVRMPEVDGFEMIEALQGRGISCKIVVTSSCPEFLYAKRAMELGAVDFLVKPLKVYEVRNVLGRLRRELESEKKWKHILNLEYIFLNAMAGKIKDDQQIGDLIKEGYGIAPEERIGVLGIGMSSNYEKYKEQVLQMLKELDPVFYGQVDLNNGKRVLHAVEVCRMAGVPYSSLRKNTPKDRGFRIVRIGLNREREELYARIDRRVDLMLEEGLEDEARRLWPLRHLNALNTVGYKELFDYFEGKTDYAEAVRLIKRNSRRYARKQLSWFRRDDDIRWFHPDDYEGIVEAIRLMKIG